MRDFLRFILSSSDQSRIVDGTIEVNDVGFDKITDPNTPPAQSLYLKFQVKNPSDGAPKVFPLFPGRLIYSALPNSSGGIVLPSWDADERVPGRPQPEDI
ncbi:MAG: hypothetical protein ACUVQO_20590 [Leptodesmis sp.]